MNFRIAITTACIVTLTCAAPMFPCRRRSPVSPEEIVQKADVIVRVTAESLVHAASVPNSLEPDSTIRFEVLEVIRGEMPGHHFDLRGALVNVDDFNDQDPPYNFVRSGGRKGTCFATSYRAGAQYLLMLKSTQRGFTVEWYALGPVNEQLHSTDDPWLLWVRAQSRQPTPIRIEPNSR